MATIIVDDDRGLDSVDRSFPAFWLPFQDVNAHNHTAQWVEKVQSTVPGDGTCGGASATCGAGPTACCASFVCCQGKCVEQCGVIVY